MDDYDNAMADNINYFLGYAPAMLVPLSQPPSHTTLAVGAPRPR